MTRDELIKQLHLIRERSADKTIFHELVVSLLSYFESLPRPDTDIEGPSEPTGTNIRVEDFVSGPTRPPVVLAVLDEVEAALARDKKLNPLHPVDIVPAAYNIRSIVTALVGGVTTFGYGDNPSYGPEYVREIAVQLMAKILRFVVNIDQDFYALMEPSRYQEAD